MIKSNSKTNFCDFSTFGLFVKTSIPSVGFLIQEAVSVFSPFTSTTQALQLPSGLYPVLPL